MTHHDYTARARLFSGNRMKLGVLAFNCSHGSTIGQLDADAIFYLRSRGLDAAAARMPTRAKRRW